MEKRKPFFIDVSEQYRKRISHFVIHLLYLLAFIAFAIVSFVGGKTFYGLVGLAFILYIPLIWVFEYLLKLRIPLVLDILLSLNVMGGYMASAFNLYELISCFDLILHGMSGIVFGALGYGIGSLFISSDAKRAEVGRIFFSFIFALAVAGAWEFIEFAIGLAGGDMQADTLVTTIHSHFLSDVRGEVRTIEGITQTVITFNNGETVTINGYLDLGLIDSMEDMLIATSGSILFVILAIISANVKKPFLGWIAPQANDLTNKD